VSFLCVGEIEVMKDSDLGEYRPTTYWEDLLRQRFDLQSVGYPYLSAAFNMYLYRAMAGSVNRGLGRLGLCRASLSKSSILDVGSGTGFWIDFWLTKGGRKIFGIDLTAQSVSILSKKYPTLKFEQRDIADPMGRSASDGFDLISAMSILHHIPSQQGWKQVLLNLGCVLKPGGSLLIMDPILRYQWWGKPFSRTSPGRPRTIVEYHSVLKESGVRVLAVIPTVTILANPVDTRWKVEFQMLGQWWNLFCRLASKEGTMRTSGWLIYLLDRFLCQLNYMQSSKLLLCRKDFC